MHCAVNHVCTHACMRGRRTVKESVNLKEDLINLKVLSAEEGERQRNVYMTFLVGGR